MSTRARSGGPLGAFKKLWRSFRVGSPGHRFLQHYRTQQKSTRRSGGAILSVALGVVLLAIGVVLMFIPGPGIPFVAVGAMLIAREFKPAAKVLDWLELWARRRAKRAKAEWKAASVPLRGLMVLGAALAAGTVAYRAVTLVV